MTEPETRRANAYGIVELTPAECRAVLTRQRLCILAVVDGDQPYAVPLFYGFDGEMIYLGIAEGRKTRALDVNPRVCVTVPEVGRGNSWRSVLIAGRAEVITDAGERARVVHVMMQHNRGADTPEASTAASDGISRVRHTGGRIMRIAGAEITGRAKG